jgi:hypothetical protein
MVAHDALVVVLTEHQDKWVRRNFFSGIAQSYASPMLSVGPDVPARAAFSELQCAVSKSQVGVNL